MPDHIIVYKYKMKREHMYVVLAIIIVILIICIYMFGKKEGWWNSKNQNSTFVYAPRKCIGRSPACSGWTPEAASEADALKILQGSK
jgi:hypothetical protein